MFMPVIPAQENVSESLGIVNGTTEIFYGRQAILFKSLFINYLRLLYHVIVFLSVFIPAFATRKPCFAGNLSTLFGSEGFRTSFATLETAKPS